MHANAFAGVRPALPITNAGLFGEKENEYDLIGLFGLRREIMFASRKERQRSKSFHGLFPGLGF